MRNKLQNEMVTHRAACAVLFSKYAHTINQSPDGFLAEADIDAELAFTDLDSRVPDSKIELLSETLEKKGDNALL